MTRQFVPIIREDGQRRRVALRLPLGAATRYLMLTVRNLRIALLTLLTLLPAATALAQTAENTSSADSPALMALLIVFCVFVVGSLAYTARRMARLP